MVIFSWSGKLLVWKTNGGGGENYDAKNPLGSSHHGSVVNEPTSIHRDAVLVPGLTQWVKDPELP